MATTKGVRGLSRLLERWRPVAPLAPDAPFYAVGDIHGCFDLLLDLLAQLEPDIPIICLGDYVDRGPDSAAVLRFLQAQPQITCLVGNHEAMLLRFLDNPAAGAPWLRYGGIETLQSFGLTIDEAPDPQPLSTQLQAAMGPDLIGWLRGLPVYWQSGNVVLTHAGADPRGPIDAQDPDHMIWGHPDFPRLRRPDGLWVVRGHAIVPSPEQQPGRISIDTGAFATGRLTAAHVQTGAVDFIETGQAAAF